MDFTAKNYQAHNTMNGVAFAADLYVDGRKAGRIQQGGNGGMTTYYFENREDEERFEDAAHGAYPDYPRTCDTDAYIEDILVASGV